MRVSSDIAIHPYQYCPSLTEYQRFATREVKIGHVPLGAHHPIRLQSMTTTDTMDTAATVAQSIRMIEAGSEYVRITAPSKREAENLAEIKKQLHAAGFHTPLVADIHFTPNAAEIAARIVEKVRVNPGNYADKKKFEVIEYTDGAYEAELERIRNRFLPLVQICKEYGTAMRIGTNHGSLSDRIMSRYGDTPLGMVESAFEFLRICEDERYYDIVLSMKASNPQVMVQAYRLLVQKMMETGRNYPLHLGVTEAGEAEDGRIKSAMGIGALLEDGLGDTVRVSLTEEPEAEIPVARELVDRYNKRGAHRSIEPIDEMPYDPFTYTRRESIPVQNIGNGQTPVVLANLPGNDTANPLNLMPLGYRYEPVLDKWQIGDLAVDYVIAQEALNFEIPGTLSALKLDKGALKTEIGKPQFRHITLADLSPEFLDTLKDQSNTVLILSSDNEHAMPEMRRAFIKLMNAGIRLPVIIHRKYEQVTEEQLRLYAATDMGSLLIDGFGDGVWLEAPGIDPKTVNDTTFGILQAARVRISKTEYISCPSCGRTLFDLQETTAMIRAKTNHLKGLKIGIMGCIVNGPGEMADADYGYVGSGPGKITLYKGKDVMKRGIPTASALDELIELIKANGDWAEA